MKKIFYCIAAVLLFVPGFAQKGNSQWQWAKALDNNLNMDKVVRDNDGNFYFILNDGYNLPKVKTYGSADIVFGKMDAAGNLAWLKSAGGKKGEIAEDICIDTDNNIIITGSSTSYGIYLDSIVVLADTSMDFYARSLFVAKFDSSGNALWGKMTKGLRSERGEAIATDRENNIYIVGYYKWSDDLRFDSLTIPPTSTFVDYGFYAKLSSNGDFLWVNGPISTPRLLDIVTDDSANLYITGNFVSDVTFDPITYQKATSTDRTYFIAKTDSSGKGIWIQDTEDKPAFDYEGLIAIDQNGNPVCGNNIKYQSGLRGSAFSKYTSNGVKMWRIPIHTSTGSGNDDDKLFSITTDNKGNTYISGAFASSDLKFSNSLKLLNTSTKDDATDMYIAKLDSSGVPQWAKNIYNSGFDKGLFVMADNVNEKIYQFGFFGSNSPDSIFLDTIVVKDKNIPVSQGQYYISMLAQCNLATSVIAKSGDTLVAPIAQSYQWYLNGIQVLGMTSRYYKPIQSARYTVVQKFAGGCTVVSEPYDFVMTGIDRTPDELQVNIYPNPTTGKFKIVLPETAEKVSIYNMSGQLIKSEYTFGKDTMDFELIQSGLYFINIHTKNQVITKRVVVL